MGRGRGTSSYETYGYEGGETERDEGEGEPYPQRKGSEQGGRWERNDATHSSAGLERNRVSRFQRVCELFILN